MTAPQNGPVPTAPVPAPPPAPTPAPAQPAPQPPAPPAAAPSPTAPTPPTAPQPQHQGGLPGPQNGPDGYPLSTPLAEMNSEQQVAYWKYQSRRHEDRVKAMADYDTLKSAYDEYQKLVTASQSDQEKAVAEALRRGRTEAMAESGSKLVEAYVRAAATGRLPDETVATLLQGLDLGKFHTNGEVDTARVYQFVGSFAPTVAAAPPVPSPEAAPGTAAPAAPTPPAPAPAPPRMPDFGQGQPTTAKPTGLEAGREIARLRFAQSKPQPKQ